jgi:hypothetical protein
MPGDGASGGGRRQQLNVLGGPLQTCSQDPVTGWYRSGCCETDANDHGSHTVCAVMTREFLEFSKARGNDLSTPRPEYEFPGLKPGDRWCLCAARWIEAYDSGAAPRVVLAATNRMATQIAPLDALKAYAVDLT